MDRETYDALQRAQFEYWSANKDLLCGIHPDKRVACKKCEMEYREVMKLLEKRKRE